MRLSFCETPAFGTSASAQIFPPSPDKDPRKRSGSIGQRAGSISAVVALLRLADTALSKSQDETRQCIESALGLLTADCDTIDAAEQPGGSLRKPSLAPWQINRVTSFIDSHLANTIRLRDLAAVTHLSARHLSRAIAGLPIRHILRGYFGVWWARVRALGADRTARPSETASYQGGFIARLTD
jgi:hypothetical protein